MNIYVASSWRNPSQSAVVKCLRDLGHQVYDFKNPAPGNRGFSWREIDPEWQKWTPDQYRQALEHPVAVKGYGHDIAALDACDVCLLVLPSGRSASWELGYAMGREKTGMVFQVDAFEPELMYREARLITSWTELNEVFSPSGAQ